MSIQIRDFDSNGDYPLVTRLLNFFYNEPRSVQSVQEADTLLPKNTITIRKIAIVNGENVGVLRITRLGNADTLWLSIIIDPKFRGKGIGSHLYKESEEMVDQLGGTVMYSQVFDHMKEGVSFAESKGFTIDRHIYESKLMITKDTPGLDYSKLNQAEDKGFIFCTMADLKEDIHAGKKLHDLYLRTSKDIPGWTEKPPTFEEFSTSVFHHSGYRPEGQFIVMKDGEWVGMSTLLYSKETNSLYTSMTGIDRKYRSNGLAYILKMLTIQYAKDAQISYMLTNNDSNNYGMIAINQKVGYQAQPGYYQMTKRL
jgi:GNAT superfamily N-acetyltransferase